MPGGGRYNRGKNKSLAELTRRELVVYIMWVTPIQAVIAALAFWVAYGDGSTKRSTTTHIAAIVIGIALVVSTFTELIKIRRLWLRRTPSDD